MVCDGYLRPKPLPENVPEVEIKFNTNTLRFFRIAESLNMDLQMLLCNRVFGLSRTIMPFETRNASFQKMFKLFLTKE